MFWSKKTIESKEFQILFNKFENLRIEVEAVKIDLKLYQNKLARKAGIKLKDDEETETETNKNPQVLLDINGNTIRNSKRA